MMHKESATAICSVFEGELASKVAMLIRANPEVAIRLFRMTTVQLHELALILAHHDTQVFEEARSVADAVLTGQWDGLIAGAVNLASWRNLLPLLDTRIGSADFYRAIAGRIIPLDADHVRAFSPISEDKVAIVAATSRSRFRLTLTAIARHPGVAPADLEEIEWLLAQAQKAGILRKASLRRLARCADYAEVLRTVLFDIFTNYLMAPEEPVLKQDPRFRQLRTWHELQDRHGVQALNYLYDFFNTVVYAEWLDESKKSPHPVTKKVTFPLVKLEKYGFTGFSSWHLLHPRLDEDVSRDIERALAALTPSTKILKSLSDLQQRLRDQDEFWAP